MALRGLRCVESIWLRGDLTQPVSLVQLCYRYRFIDLEHHFDPLAAERIVYVC